MPTERDALIAHYKQAGMDDAARVATEMLSPSASNAADVPTDRPEIGVEIPGAPPALLGAGDHLTVEDIKQVTTDQINERWDEVSAVMSRAA